MLKKIHDRDFLQFFDDMVKFLPHIITLKLSDLKEQMISIMLKCSDYDGRTLACWISSLLHSFEGSNVKDILTSLVATTSTDIPKSSKIENTWVKYSIVKN